MNRSDVTIEELFAFLPALEELEVLRLRLMSAAVPDPRREWDSSSEYATIDKRIVSPALGERALAEAEEALHQHVAALHEGMRMLLRSVWSGGVEETVRLLVEMGERLEEGGRSLKARQCYDAALALALPLADKRPQILALRRIGRVALAVGDFQEALSCYERSTELAHDTGDLRGEVVGRTGIGNVRLWQGRWPEAERCYRDALALAERAPGPQVLHLERGQLYNNLGNISTRQERLDEAEEWFDRALRLWEEVDSPSDRAICSLNQAHLREFQGRREEAMRIYQKALALPVASGLRAVIATDLANAYLQEGHLSEAERWGREAEEHAIAARSPYSLGFMYQGRGRIALARGDVDGFIFFEKALEIARDKGYPFLEAETLVDYALLRMQAGGAEEAQAYLEHARGIFAALGAPRFQARAEQLLAEIAAAAPLAAAAD